MDINSIMKPCEYNNESVSSEISLPYRIYVPENYDCNKKYSLLIYMHGAGERGTNNEHLCLPSMYRYFTYILEDEKLKDEFILIAPQCHPSCRWVEHGWGQSVYDYSKDLISVPLTLFYRLLDKEILVKYNIDKKSILMTGMSMGGFATWFTMMTRPDFLAAAIPVCGGADPKMAEALKNIPIWIFHSDDDPIVPSDSFHAMKKAMEDVNAADFHATLYQHDGHDSWTRAYLEKPTFDWFMSKRK